jgi:V/A-type H+/Na+-transporting ATPase subunit E
MQTKLQELTEKIYQEGVNKANEEADKIVSQAKKEAEELVSKAKKEADEIVKKAEKDAEELTRNSLNELQLSARQAISDLKQKVVNLIETKTIGKETKDAFQNSAFVQVIIQTIVEKWSPDDAENVELSLLLPKDKQKEFDAFFKGEAKQLLDKGLEVKYSEKVKTGFKIGPKDEGYQISFSDADFDHFFRNFMRPRLVELLYEEKKK